MKWGKKQPAAETAKPQSAVGRLSGNALTDSARADEPAAKERGAPQVSIGSTLAPETSVASATRVSQQSATLAVGERGKQDTSVHAFGGEGGDEEEQSSTRSAESRPIDKLGVYFHSRYLRVVYNLVSHESR